MNLIVVLLFLCFSFQNLEVTIAGNDSLLLRMNGTGKKRSSSRSLQVLTNDHGANDTSFPTAAPSTITDSPANGTEVPSNQTSTAPATSAPSSATLEPTLASDETQASDSSPGLQATDIALIVVGLIGIGFLAFGVLGSFLSGSKNAVNENAGADVPAPMSAPAAPEVEIAEA